MLLSGEADNPPGIPHPNPLINMDITKLNLTSPASRLISPSVIGVSTAKLQSKPGPEYAHTIYRIYNKIVPTIKQIA